MVDRTEKVSGLPPPQPPESPKTPPKMGDRAVTHRPPTPSDVSLSTQVKTVAGLLRKEVKSLTEKKVTKGEIKK